MAFNNRKKKNCNCSKVIAEKAKTKRLIQAQKIKDANIAAVLRLKIKSQRAKGKAKRAARAQNAKEKEMRKMQWS